MTREQLATVLLTEVGRQSGENSALYVGDERGDLSRVIVDGDVDFLALAEAIINAEKKTPEA